MSINSVFVFSGLYKIDNCSFKIKFSNSGEIFEILKKKIAQNLIHINKICFVKSFVHYFAHYII